MTLKVLVLLLYFIDVVHILGGIPISTFLSLYFSEIIDSFTEKDLNIILNNTALIGICDIIFAIFDI